MTVVETPIDREIGKWAALQSIAELGLGSLVHSLRIPLGGHALSLNQVLLLTFSARRNKDRAVSVVSGVSITAAVLKSLSPAGKRVMPMVAIATQGLLYSFGLVLFGATLMGALVGAVLSSVWGVIQPLLFGYLIFGKGIYISFVELWKWGVWILVALVLLKIVLAISIVVWAWEKGSAAEEKYMESIDKIPAFAKGTHPSTGIFQELTHPWFIAGVLMNAVFWLLLQHEVAGLKVWIYVLRPLAIAGLGFWLIRSIPPGFWVKIASRHPILLKSVHAANSQLKSKFKNDQ